MSEGQTISQVVVSPTQRLKDKAHRVLRTSRQQRLREGTTLHVATISGHWSNEKTAVPIYYANGDRSGCWFGRHAHELAKIVRLASATVLSKHANNSVNTMTGSIPATLIINSYPASAQNMRLTSDRHNQCHIDHRAVVISTAYSNRQKESNASHQGKARHPVYYSKTQP